MSSAPCQIETMPTGGGSKQIFICIAGTFQLHVSEPMPLITTSFAHVSHTSPPSKRTPQKIPLCSINSPPEIPPFHLISSPLSLSLSLSTLFSFCSFSSFHGFDQSETTHQRWSEHALPHQQHHQKREENGDGQTGPSFAHHSGLHPSVPNPRHHLLLRRH